MNQTIIDDAIASYSPFAGQHVDVEELSDGNINYVYRLKAHDASVILKYAAGHLRSSGRPLDPKRNRIEARYYETMTAVSDYFPQVYTVNAERGYFLMEDLKEYTSLSQTLLNGIKVPNLGQTMAAFCAQAIEQGQALTKNVAAFDNDELKDITRRLVFTEPYTNDMERNQVTPGMESFVQKNLYDDELLASRARVLKERFEHAKDILLHGDLHDRSVWVKGASVKILDPEFATWGPAGFDAGMFWGNLWMAYFFHRAEKNDSFASWLHKEITAFYDAMQQMNVPSLLDDVVSIAGLEMIRRTVGDARNPWIETGISEQIAMEKAILTQGKAMVLEGNHREVHHD